MTSPKMPQSQWSDFAEGGADKNGWRPVSEVPRDRRVEILGLDGRIWRARFQLEYDNPFPEGTSDWDVGCIASYRFHEGELVPQDRDNPQYAYNIFATHWRNAPEDAE